MENRSKSFYLQQSLLLDQITWIGTQRFQRLHSFLSFFQPWQQSLYLCVVQSGLRHETLHLFVPLGNTCMHLGPPALDIMNRFFQVIPIGPWLFVFQDLFGGFDDEVNCGFVLDNVLVDRLKERQ